jgi:plastocyanin
MMHRLLAAMLCAACLQASALATIHTVNVGSNFFSPVNTTVNHGDTVRFVRTGGTHTSTSDPGSPKSWDSGVLQAGVPYDVEIKASDGAGPFPFHCDFHPSMQGTIFVQSLDVNIEVEDVQPRDFAVAQNYPNPFNPTTTIRISLARATEVNFAVYNVAGQLVEQRDLGMMAPGTYSLIWSGTSANGTELPSGVYFYRIEADGAASTRKMILLR